MSAGLSLPLLREAIDRQAAIKKRGHGSNHALFFGSLVIVANLTGAGSDELGPFFFEVSQNELAVASLFLERFLTFAFLLVLFLTAHAKSCERQNFQTS
jgi:hypothetical protein